MTLSKQHIMNRVNRHEQSRAGYLALTEEWERMWKLDPGFDRTVTEAVEEGQEQVVLPTPFNVVNLSQRLLSSVPHTKILPLMPGEKESEDQAEETEKFLRAMWKRIGQLQHRSVLNDIILYNLLRGRFAIEVKWIEDILPAAKKGNTFPILIRPLDPKNVGVEQGPIYTSWVYHRYETSVFDVLQRWPDLDKTDSAKIRGILDTYDDSDGQGEDVQVTMIDFWWVDQKTGKIWNAVLCEDEFVKEPVKTKYPDLPIVVGRGDYAPGLGDDYDGLSILHPLLGLWDYQCRLASQMATGLLWHFWPAILVRGGSTDMKIGPGQTTYAGQDTDVQLIQIDPNVPLAQTVYNQIDQHIQQSAYPEVMYGKAPGDIQAGYGVSLLSDAAKGRIKNFQEGLEIGLGQVNTLVLGIIEAFAATKGVSIWGYDQRDKTKYHLTLNKEKIGGNYENEVSITPVIPSAMMQLQTLGIRLADANYISRQTLRDNFLDTPVPSDEEARLGLQELIDSDELRAYRLRQAAVRWQPEDWMKVLSATPESRDLLPIVPGYSWTPEGKLEKDQEQPMLGGLPPGMSPDMMMPQMPPPGPPPGMQMAPPGMGGPPPVQPGMVMTGPDGAGGPIPPAMQGLMQPGMMGAGPQDDPAAFAQLMGQPLPPGDELIRLAGGIPPGA